MVQSVYVDILLCTNFFVHILLLSLTSGIFHRSSEKKSRLFTAAVVGACFSLTIFLPSMSAVTELILKLSSVFGVVRIAFCWKGWKRFLLESAGLFAVSGLFYGILSAVQKIYTVSGLFIFDNAIYFHIRVPIFIICLTAAYAVVWVLHRILSSFVPQQELYRVKLTIDGRTKEITGFLDTGNHLSEPFSGLPVIICGLSLAASLLSDDLLEAVLGKENEQSCRVRRIPFSAVSGSGLLAAVKGERIVLTSDEETFCCEEFYVAFSKERIGDEDWQILLHTKLLNRSFSVNKQDEIAFDARKGRV